MRQIKITTDVDVFLTPKDLANIFSEMNDIEQSQFFNHVGEMINDWDHGYESLKTQLNSISNCGELKQHGYNFLRQLSDHFKKL